MIIKVNLAYNISDMLSYNQKKVAASSETNLVARVLGTSVPLDDNALMYFKYAGESNKNSQLKLKYIHIKIAVHKSDVLSDYTFYKIGIDVMEGLGISRFNRPYILYRHYDTEDNPHIHVIASRTSYYSDTSSFKHYKYRAMELSRGLEFEYGLTSALNKNLDVNGIKEVPYYTSQVELKNESQSQFQQIRDIVSDALGSSPSFAEFINCLSRHNVITHLRVEENSRGILMIGVSYALVTGNPEVRIDKPSISTEWELKNEYEAIRELCTYRFTTSENRMYYLNSSNQARENDSPYFADEFKDFAISARKLGPGAGWFSLKKRYKSDLKDRHNELLTTYLTPQHLVSGKKKVWKIDCKEIVPQETLAEKLSMLGIKEHNPGYLLESMNLGVDFSKLLQKKTMQLHPYHSLELNSLATLQKKHYSPKEIILTYPKVRQRYLCALNIDFRQVGDEEALNYAVGYLTEEVNGTAFDIHFPQEISLRINNIKEVKPELVQKDLLAYFLEGNEEMLRIAIRHPDVEFSVLIHELKYSTIERINIADDIIDTLELRIAQEIYRDPYQAEVQQKDLEQHVRLGKDSLRYLTKMINLDFSGIDTNSIGIEDPKLKKEVLRRINTDMYYLPKNVKEYQLKLEQAAVIDNDFDTVLSYLKMPMLDFTKITVQHLLNHIYADDLARLEKRIEKDKTRSEKLALFREGKMEVDLKTNRIIEIRVPIQKKVRPYDRGLEGAIALSRTNREQDKGLSM